MAYSTIEKIIKAAIGGTFKVYDNIPDAYIKQAVNFYNASEPFIWRKWPWHNRKVDEIEVTPDSNGIIVFNESHSDVDMVRAVKAVQSGVDGSVLIWNETAIRSAINGEDIGSGKFQHLSDDANGNRRIKVSSDDGVSSYKVLAFRRFLKAEVSDGYDGSSPDTTPNDYRVLTWKIDRAEAALIAYIADELKKWNHEEGNGGWSHALNGSIKDVTDQEANEQLFTPSEGNFGEQGNWY